MKRILEKVFSGGRWQAFRRILLLSALAVNFLGWAEGRPNIVFVPH